MKLLTKHSWIQTEMDNKINAHRKGNTFPRGVTMSRFWMKRAYVSAAFLIVCAVGVGAQAPSAPVLKSPANGVAGQSIIATLSWTSAASATSYEVQLSTSSGFGTTTLDQTGTALSVLVKNLTASTVYFWHARASNTGGASGWASTWSFTTFHYVYDTATGDNMSIALTLTSHPTIDGVPLGVYDEIGVFSKAGLCVGSAIWDSVKSKNINVVGQDPLALPTVDGLNGGDSMFFRVWDYSAQKEVLAVVTFSSGGATYASGGDAIISSLAGISSPDQPTLVSPANGLGGQMSGLSLSWNSAARAATYSVQVSTTSAFSTTVVSRSGITALSAAITGLSYSAAYYWMVNATNAASASGAWSGIWSFTTLVAPGAPTLSSPSNGTATQVGKTTTLTLSWGTVATATSYTLQVSTTSSFSTTFVNQTGLTVAAYAVTNWPASAVYYWRVSAANGAGAGAWSPIWNITITVPVLSNESAAEIAPSSFSFRNGSLFYTLSGASRVEIVFYDILGRTALAISRAESAGSHVLNLKNANIAPGRYLARLKSGSFEKQISLFIAQ